MRRRIYYMAVGYIGIGLAVLLATVPARATLVGSDKSVADATQAALHSLSQAYQMSGLREVTENLSKRYLGEALGRKLPEWAGDAIVSILSEHRGPSLGEKLNDPKIRAEMKARLSARLQQEIPKLAKSVVIDKLFNGVIAENDPQAKKIIDQLVRGMTTPLNTQADEWAGRLYDKAMGAAEPYIQYNLRIGKNSLLLDATDLRGTISRAVSIDTVGDIVSGAMSEALGESAYGEVQRRFNDFMDGNLPPELSQAIRAGPDKIDALIAQGKSYLPTEQLKALKDKLLAMPVITIPNEVYGGVLAGSAARHFALAFAEFPAVNAYELNRGREVTQVLLWQLKNKQGMNLNVGQLLDLANLAMQQMGGLGTLGQFGRTVQEARDKIDEMQKDLKTLEDKITKGADLVSAEVRQAAQQLESKLKEYQDYIAKYPREWVDGVTKGLKEGADKMTGKIPDWLHVPKDWKDFKKQTGIPEKIFGEWGDKDLLDHTGIRDAAKKANKDASDQLASVLVDAARALLPKPEITPEEKVPAQNPDENGDYDPVLLHNGEFVHPVVDVTIPGRGLDFQLTRTYRSRSHFLGRLGWNWTHNYEESLQTWYSPVGPGITWVTPEGRKYFFRAREDRLGEFESPEGVFAVLKTVGRGEEKSFELQKSGGMVTRFDRHGFLRETCDRFGNCIRCERDASGLLLAIVDTVGRRTTFQYDTVGRITELHDAAGRAWQYQYDAHGDLTSVTAPATDAYPDGITTAYYYSSGQDDAALNHNMTQIRDPRGAVFLRNVFGKTGLARDQVVAQQYGGPQNFVKSRYVLLRPRWLIAHRPDAANIAVDRVDLRDRRGVVKRFWHNAAGNLLRQEIVDARGKVHAGVQYRYNADGMRVATVKPSGLTLHEEYWKAEDRLLQGLVVKRVLGENREWRYRYEAKFGEMSQRNDPEGVVSRWVYDDRGALTEYVVYTATDSKTRIRTQVEANDNGQIIQVRDPRGTLIRYDYDGANRIAEIQDASGRRLTTRYAYDIIGNIIAITLSNGGVRKLDVDAQNLIRHEITPLGYERRYDYDAHGNVTAMRVGGYVYRFEYDVLDRLSRRIEPVDATHEAITQYAHDIDGRLSGVTFPEGNRMRITYDAWGHLTAIERGAGTREAGFTQYQYDADGNRVGEVNGLGHLTELEHNAFGEVTAVIYPNKTRQEITRDAAGRVVEVAWKDAAGTILASEKIERDALGLHERDLQWDSQNNSWRETQREFDAMGNLTQVIQPSGAVTRFVYDAVGNRTQALYPENLAESWQYNELGAVVAYQGAAKSKNLSSYDIQGRLTVRTDPNGAVTKFAYDDRDNVIEEIPSEGATIRYTYDGAGRRTAVAWGERITRYDWDGNGRLRTLADPLDRATRYTYDTLDRLLTEHYPDGGAATMSYDANGQVVKRCHPNGNCVTQDYDAMGNMVARQGSDLQLSYRYDPMGRMVSAQAGDAISRFVYSSLSEVAESAQGPHRFKTAYDANGRRQSMRFENGNSIQWQRDAIGRITQVEGTGGFGIAQTWGVHGPEKIAYGNDRSDAMAYDGMGNVISQIPSPLKGEGGGEGKIQYQYNLLGNLISQNSTTYTYDPWQQLIRVGTEQWRYNLNGEREQPAELSFDKNGNMISDGRHRYIYDTLGRLQEVRDADGRTIARYTYDALDRRVAKEVAGHVTTYVYDGWEPVEIYEDGNLVEQFVRGDDLDAPFGAISGTTPLYFHRDRLGSVMKVSDSTGKIVEQTDYDAWGGGQSEGLRHLPRRFTGQIFDAETGLYYMRNRYYSPQLGQFLTRDPLGYKNSFRDDGTPLLPISFTFHHYLGAAAHTAVVNQVHGNVIDSDLYVSLIHPQDDRWVETNLYMYARNNPVMYIDPTGLYWEYSQRSGNVIYIDNRTGVRTFIERGYSGHGAGLNNPDMQQVREVGPIPRGVWTVGNPFRRGSMNNVMRLTPDRGTETFHRGGFQIHPDRTDVRYGASHGCIILSPNTRLRISRSRDRELRVIE